MRIISGKYKRRRFEVPKNFKARPTTDFAKENLFNVLTHYIDFEDNIRALDLFSGTGSITAELLSRGCASVVALEKDYAHYQFIVKVLKELNAPEGIPLKGDVFRYLNSCRQQFDFIFADPPYELKELATLPDIIFNHELLSDKGIFVLEHGKNHDFQEHRFFMEARRYGSVNFSFFSKKRSE